MATLTDVEAAGPAKGRREIRCHDDRVGIDGVIVIDDTTLGPGLGGVRFKPYPASRPQPGSAGAWPPP